MEFRDKIKKLMQMFKITNSQLAESLDIDVSLVSRWRTGDRMPSSRGNHIEQMASFFVEYSIEKELLNELTNLIGLSTDSNRYDDEYVKEQLTMWLLKENNEGNSEYIGEFINKVDFFTRKNYSELSVVESSTSYNYSMKESYLGSAGKKEVIIRLLTRVVESEPTDIYFYSDEQIEWITDDIEFYFLFNKLLSKALNQGHRLRIIQPYHEDFRKMMATVERWLPIYLSGNIETYYYPDDMKSLFGNTVILADGIASILSSSLADKPNNSINFYVTNKDTVDSIRNSFVYLVGKCQSLVNIFGKDNQSHLIDYILSHGKEPGDLLTLHQTLSVMTIPLDFLRELSDSEALCKIHLKRLSLLHKNLEKYRYIEVLPLPSVEDIDRGKVKVQLSVHISDEPVYYNRKTFRRHLENMLQWLEEYPNYCVILLDQFHLKDVRISVKRDSSAILYKISPKPVALTFNNMEVIESFHDYVLSVINQSENKIIERESVVRRIKDFVEKL